MSDAQRGAGGAGRTMSNDDPMFLGLIVVGLYIALWASWHFFHTQIAMAYGYYRYALLSIPASLGAVGIPGLSSVNEWLQGYCQPSHFMGPCTRDFSQVTWKEIADSSFWVNLFFFLLILAYAVRLFLIANKTHPKLNFVKKHTVKSFAKAQQVLYPHLRMFGALAEKLIDASLDHPVFGMAKNSKQFIFDNQLVVGWREEDGGGFAPTLHRDKMHELFKRQLGSRYKGKFTVAEALLAAIALPRVAATDSLMSDEAFEKAKRDSESMVQFCWDQFKPPPAASKKTQGTDHELSWLKPTIDMKFPMEIIREYLQHESVQKILMAHAYTRTILFASFVQARRVGVLQPAEMRWLRYFDRELWYVLQTFGRQAGYVEAAGVLSHYLYECKAGTALTTPQVDKACSGLEQAIAQYRFSKEDVARYNAGATKPHETPESSTGGKGSPS